MSGIIPIFHSLCVAFFFHFVVSFVLCCVLFCFTSVCCLCCVYMLLCFCAFCVPSLSLLLCVCTVLVSVSCTPISFTQSRLFFTVSACVCQSILCLCLCSGIFLLLDSILVCAWRLGCLRALVDFCCRSPVCCLCGCFSVYIYLLSPILCLHFSPFSSTVFFSLPAEIILMMLLCFRSANGEKVRDGRSREA